MLMSLLKNPNEFFASVKPEQLRGKVLFFGMLCLFLGIVFESSEQLLLFKAFAENEILLKLIPAQQMEVVQKQLLLTLFFSPATAFFGIYLFGSALHFLIRGFVTSPKTSPVYETTLGLVALCQIPMLFSLVPILGSLIASIWVFVLLMKALRQVYGLSSFMAFTCILTPALFLKMTWGSALQLLALSL